MRKIIKADGAEVLLDRPHSITQISALLDSTALDTVTLADGLVMLVDDQGYDKGLPVNETASALYHARCRPGTTHMIVGDVAIVPDADFGG